MVYSLVLATVLSRHLVATASADAVLLLSQRLVLRGRRNVGALAAANIGLHTEFTDNVVSERDRTMSVAAAAYAPPDLRKGP